MSKRFVFLMVCLFLVMSVISYAAVIVNIEPNKEGVIGKSKEVNIVVKLTSDLLIDMGQVVIEWDGQDITQELLESATSQLNDSKTEITFYYPISASDLPPGQHTIAATTGNGKWYDSTLTILDVDEQSLHFSYSTTVVSTETDSGGELIKAAKQTTKDTTKPKVKSMSVDPSTVYSGDKVKISYKVTDNIALKQVELWYKKPGGDWQGVETKSISGTSKSGSFDHRPSTTGTNKYGIHVVDKAGNWDSEGSAGPKSVTVKQKDTTKPTIVSFSVSPSTINQGDTVTISYSVKDSGGSGLNKVELWKGTSKDKLGNYKQDSASGDSKVGQFADKPSAGTVYYGIHVLDKADNMTADNGAKPVTVTAKPILKITDITGYSDGLGVVNGKWTGQGPACNNAHGKYYNYYAAESQNSSYWIIKGSGFGTTKGSVSVSDSSITLTISSWKDSQIKITTKVPYTYTSKTGVTLTVKNAQNQSSTPTTISTIGIIKSRGYGQCTWYVANKRLEQGKTIPPSAYSSTTIDVNYVPQQWDALNYGGKHVGIITTPVKKDDKNGIVTYSFTVGEMNAKCDESELSYAAQFSVDSKNKKITKSIGSNAGSTYLATGFYR